MSSSQMDIELAQELLGLDTQGLCDALGISRVTLHRWSKDPDQISASSKEALYSYVFEKGIRLNDIHAQLFAEEARANGDLPLFHGSKSGIEGPLDITASRPDNDFGKGFYCGENMAQASIFVARYPKSCCYFVGFNPRGLRAKTFAVEQDWMLAIAYFRGRLEPFASSPAVQAIVRAVESADYVVAPIADNRMFQIIDRFIDGEITDVQCEHSLSATDLGMQYVLRTDAALQAVRMLRPRYLCAAEKEKHLAYHRERALQGSDKAKAALRAYRGQGLYIEEILS